MINRNIDCRLLFLLLLAGAFCHGAETDDVSGLRIQLEGGWMEVKSSATNDTELVSSLGVEQPGGDKLYIVEPGDTLAIIAERFTANKTNRHSIASYNGIKSSGDLTEGNMVLIPASLLTNQRPIQKTTSQIREFTPVLMRPVDAVESQIPSYAVETKNIDMFMGEVSVLEKVAVTRVAVGKGSVVRAEVLATGELLVIAQSAGSTSLRLWHVDGRQSDYNIRVSETDPETRFRMEKMVRLRVKMVEFRKSALGRLGIDWGESIVGPTLATAGDFVSNSLFRPAAEGFSESLPGNVRPFSSYFGIATSLTSRINFLASTGDAVLLAEPTLSCANGGSAQFLAGGEVPYPTIGANGQTTVEFKEYGIKLDISPRIDTSGNVQTAVLTEISSIDPAVSVQGAPGLLTRRTQTQVNVRTGQTIVIAGLLKAENSNDVDKLPGIGNLPILGALFRSKNIRNDVSELVIFITPEVVDPVSEEMNDREIEILESSTTQLSQARARLKLNLLE